MSNNQKISAWAIGLTVVILGGYDIWAGVHGGYQATISWVMWDQSHTYPIIPFLMGFLCGHLFTQMIFPRKNVAG